MRILQPLQGCDPALLVASQPLCALCISFCATLAYYAWSEDALVGTA